VSQDGKTRLLYPREDEDEPGEKALNNFRAAIKKLLLIEDGNPRTR
jgi:hypothetical protein